MRKRGFIATLLEREAKAFAGGGRQQHDHRSGSGRQPGRDFAPNSSASGCGVRKAAKMYDQVAKRDVALLDIHEAIQYPHREAEQDHRQPETVTLPVPEAQTRAERSSKRRIHASG